MAYRKPYVNQSNVEILKDYTAKRRYIQRHIDTTNGEFFSIQFFKRDGALRNMTARTGVQIGVKGVGYGYEREENLVTVYDVNASSPNREVRGAFRTVNTDTTQNFTYRGIRHNFTNLPNGKVKVERVAV